MGSGVGAAMVSSLVILFVVLGFATDHWVDIDVDRSVLSDVERSLSDRNQMMARVYHTRHKGIFRECYSSSDAELFLNQAQNKDGQCFYLDFDNPKGMDMSTEYTMRMNLMRGFLATYVLGLVGVILTFILGLTLCFAKNCHVAHAAAICSFFGAIFVLTSIMLFHAQEYVEANEEGDPGEIVFHNIWSQDLLKATDSELGYSYPLAWVGLILAIFDGVLFILASRELRNRQLSDDENNSSTSSTSSDRHRVLKKNNSRELGQAYDNYGMKYALPIAAPSASPYYSPVQGYHQPAYMHKLPVYPSMTYGHSVYRPSDTDYSAVDA